MTVHMTKAPAQPPRVVPLSALPHGAASSPLIATSSVVVIPPSVITSVELSGRKPVQSAAHVASWVTR